jgi:hypothetical protein
MHQNNCSNCAQTLNGPFCSQCGQKEAHRYTVKHVLHELVHVFTHADKGIFSFAWNILRKPGTVSLDLVQGKRKRYFNLFQYLLLVVGFVTFIIVKTDFMGEMMKTMNGANETQVSSRVAEVQKEVSQLFQKYNNILQMLLIPAFALFSWLFIGRKQFNYAENIVLQTASSAQTNTIAIFTTPLFYFFRNTAVTGVLIALSFGITLFSFTLAYRQFYKLSFVKSILYALLVFVCGYMIQMLLTFVIIVIVAIVHFAK